MTKVALADLVAVAVIIVGAIVIVGDVHAGHATLPPPPPPPSIAASRHTPDIAAARFYALAIGGHRIGDSRAPVVAVLFSDFSCSHCRVAAFVVDTVERRFPGIVSFVVRNFLLGNDAMVRRSANAAECAAQDGAFAAYFHALFSRQELVETANGWRDVADSVGLPHRAAFDQCVLAGATDSAINADTKAGIAVGVRATPTWFIDGDRYVGDMSADSMSRLVALELTYAGVRNGR